MTFWWRGFGPDLYPLAKAVGMQKKQFPKYRLGHLEISARRSSQGHRSGWHASKQLGAGTDFSQFRSYQPGDDLRRLDWKLLARSGRHYIREAEIERQIKVAILLDCSASMAHEENGLEKLDQAKELVAGLAQICQQQGDQFGLLAVNEHQLVALRPGLGSRQLRRLYQMLLDLEAEGTSGVNLMDQISAYPLGTIDFFFVISDFYEANTEWTQLSKSLRPGKEVIHMHLLGEQEKTLPQKGWIEARDLETGERLQIDAEAARAAYQSNLQAHCANLSEQLSADFAHYVQVSLQDTVEESLSIVLGKKGA